MRTNTFEKISKQVSEQTFDAIDLKKKRYDSFLTPSFLTEYLNLRKGHIYEVENYGVANKNLSETTARKLKILVQRFTKKLNHQEISNLLACFLEKSLNKIRR
jgi:hypothetical protein